MWCVVILFSDSIALPASILSISSVLGSFTQAGTNTNEIQVGRAPSLSRVFNVPLESESEYTISSKATAEGGFETTFSYTEITKSSWSGNKADVYNVTYNFNSEYELTHALLNYNYYES